MNRVKVGLHGGPAHGLVISVDENLEIIRVSPRPKPVAITLELKPLNQVRSILPIHTYRVDPTNPARATYQGTEK